MSDQPTDDAARRAGEAYARLVRIIARLRAPDGCPWDQKQTLETMKRYLLEETYETLEAIDSGDVDAHREELGDLLMQIVFQAQIRQEAEEFDAADVAQSISDKMVRRHPHVFGDAKFETEAELKRAWAESKKKEGRESALDGVPTALPALLRAFRIGNKAASVGFDWPDTEGVVDKIGEEAGELREAMAAEDQGQIHHELGDLLFSVVNLCRHLKVDPESALQGTTRRFEARFRHLERSLKAEGLEIGDQPIDALEARWQAAKRALAETER